jgi:hypothetical protein
MEQDKKPKNFIKTTLTEFLNENATSTEDIPNGFGFSVDFIIWMGRYKMQIIKTSEGEKWYSGSKYWQFDDVKSMYNYYIVHNNPTEKRLGDGRAKYRK